MPRDERQYPDLIFGLQAISRDCQAKLWPVDLFRMSRLYVCQITTHYFTGSPLLLTQFLDDQYLKRNFIGLDEAEALATYILLEAKDYDAYCGKHSDVFVLKNDGNLGRLTLAELEHWEEHWRHLKNAVGILPLLSCTTGAYDLRQDLQQFSVTLRTISEEQKKMRLEHRVKRNELEEKLIKNLAREARRRLKAEERRDAKKLSKLHNRSSPRNTASA